MKKGFVLQSLICLLAVSCSVHEMETTAPVPAEDDVFYASLESYSTPDTRVYVDVNTVSDGKFLTFWDAEDKISIFNGNTLNKQYEFMGETGDNSGYFKKISEGTGTGSSANYVCAVYPYQESTLLDDSSVLTLTLPEEQTYREASFGPGANTMVSTTNGENNLLRFLNVGGYLVFKFYGGSKENPVSVSSIQLEGRNGELLSGEATITPVIGEDPAITMTQNAGTSITITSSKAVKLEKNANKATLFWMVVPPTEFTQGFKVTVTDKDGKIFIKETDQPLTIERNRVSTMAAVEVKPADPLDPNKVIYYTTSDKSTITPAEGADFGANIVSNEYIDLKGVMIFDGDVTKIGDNAFNNCAKLTGMTIPAQVTIIGDYAFAGCTSLGATNTSTPASPATMAPAKAPARGDETSLVIPYGVTSIGAYAFKDCESLTSIIIPDSVTSIGDGAFEGCTNLTDINIPDTVEDLGQDVFKGCTSITSVTIPYGVTSIDDYAFAGCSNLTEVIIPETVNCIGKYAFYECLELSSITIPDGVKRIEKFTFAACHSLTSIIIPDGVWYIGDAAFTCCSTLANVSLPDSVEEIENSAFSDCQSLTTFSIPPLVTRISDYIFDQCTHLSNIDICEGVESIGWGAFRGCSELTRISIPNTVTSIGNDTFFGCSGLVSINVEAITPPQFEIEPGNPLSTFDETNDCPIFVPAESLEAYKTDEGWSNYASRIHGPAYGQINEHDYVDLGGGVKWATMNVGAAASEENGDLLSWSYGKAAAESWAGSWRLPTSAEWESLFDMSKYTWIWNSEKNGYTVESKILGYAGNSIFLPAAGLYDSQEPDWNIPRLGFYWSSTLGVNPVYFGFDVDDPDNPLFVDEGGSSLCMSIRPVSD